MTRLEMLKVHDLRDAAAQLCASENDPRVTRRPPRTEAARIDAAANATAVIEGPATSAAVEAASGQLFRTRLHEQLLQRLGGDALGLWFGRYGASLREDDAVVTVENDFLADCIRHFCWQELLAATHAAGSPQTRLRIEVGSVGQESNRTASPQIVPLGHPVAPGVIRAAMGRRDHAMPDSPAVDSPNAAAADERREPRAAKRGEAAARAVVGKTATVSRPIDGASNRLALSTAGMILERPGQFGIVFLYGPSGCGKTHLLKWLGQSLKELPQIRRSVRMSAEQFTIEYVDASRNGSFGSFRRKFAELDALIIEDLQFLGGKRQTINALRQTLDELSARHCQIILSADRPAAELTMLGADMIGRIASGINIVMEPLDGQIRIDLLRRLCRDHQIELDDATLRQLADRVAGDGRCIYGLLFRLAAQKRACGGRLTREDALGCVIDLIHLDRPMLRISDVEKAVCESTGLTAEELRGKSRSKAVASARMLAMYLARRYTDAAYAEIGSHFGNRQHSTVISAAKRAEQLLSSGDRTGRNKDGLGEIVKAVQAKLRVG